MCTLYTYSINIHDLEIDIHQDSGEEYDDYEEAGYAEFDELFSDSVYAESLVSAEDAKRLVFEECQKLAGKFISCCYKILI